MKKKKKLSLITRITRFIKEQYILYTNNFNDYEPIFIVGCGHSGTTVLLRIIANHKDVYGVPYESKAFQGNYPKMSKVLEWNKKVKEEKKLRWVEKTPKHIQYIDRILKIFPKAKVVVIQRDGRDVTVSIRKRFGDSQMAMDRWIEDNKASLQFSSDPRVSFIRLEDLTAQPEETVKKVCKDINLSYYPELLNYQNSEFKFDNQKPIKTDSVTGENHIKK